MNERNRLATTWSTRLAAVLAIAATLVVSVSASGRQETARGIERTPADAILVTPEWLSENAGSVTVLDTRGSLSAFTEGHIPGAAFVAREVTWDTVDGIAGNLPSPEIVAADLEDVGVRDDRPVVVYDAGNGLWASRVFWALEYLGHTQVHLLDGGLAAWTAAGYDVTTEVTVPERGNFAANVRPSLIATTEELLEELGNDTLAVLDARSPGEYAGTDVRSARGGHIPGSINVDWVNNIGDGTSFKTTTALAALYDEALSGRNGPAVALCQTGVRGAHTYVALRVLGHEDVRVYDGSWEEWGNRTDVPVAN
ncbi:MAG: sulfurtransferase [Spirochaetaceae bacterium]|nr:MAG: sulfurtransferase [Spirochaetaceae bacterium]